MAGYVCVRPRRQMGLPACLDDAVGADAPVRVLDAFVRGVDLRALGFARAGAGDVVAAGRSSYDPAALACLLLYGGMEGVRSSRRLARECARNAEARWLMEDARPCFKTIADFRRENRAALVELNREFVRFCRLHGLTGGEVVAVDGAKFQSAAGGRRAYSEVRLARELAAVERRTEAYLAALEAADVAEAAAQLSAADAAAEGARVKALLARLARLAKRKGELRSMSDGLAQSGASYCVEGEADARVMKKRGGGRMAGYNVQAAVDSKHELVVHVEATNAANDHAQLEAQAQAAKAALGAEELTVLADAGYRNAGQMHACEAAGMTVVSPAPRVVNPKGKGNLFARDEFAYDAGRDAYTCPAGETLILRRADAKLQMRYYQAPVSACAACALQAQCTEGKRRTVKRHLHADAEERANRRAAAHPAWMLLRAAFAEHPFAHMKRNLGGVGRFSLRGLAGAQAEISLSVLAYNMRRAINIVGAERLCVMLAAGPMTGAVAMPGSALVAGSGSGVIPTAAAAPLVAPP